MSLFKFIIGLIVVGCIVVIVREVRKQYSTEAKDERVASDLKEELNKVNDDLYRTDIEEDVVDAKVQLKNRREEIAKKAEALDEE